MNRIKLIGTVVFFMFVAAVGTKVLVEVICKSTPPLPPILVCPSELDLGEHEIGAVVIGRLEVANRGGQPLVIENVSTNCSCTGLEEEQNGNYVRVDRLVVAPGAVVPLIARLSVRGFPIGSRGSTTISFDTSDPERPRYNISIVVARVKGGVQPVPDTAVFGTLAIGSEQKRIVHLFDDALDPREIDSVTSSDPDRVRISLLPPDTAKCTVPFTGKHIADLAIFAKSQFAGDLTATIHISLKGQQRSPDSIRVIGQFVSDLDLAPAAVSFPLRSANEDVFELSCICRSPNAMPFKLSAVASTPSVLVSVSETDKEKTIHTIRISATRPKELVLASISLTATFVDGHTANVVLPVTVKPGRGMP